MDCEIIDRREDSTIIEITCNCIKPFSFILINSSDQYCSKFLMNYNKMFKSKMVPFFLEHFLIYLDKQNQREEYIYLNRKKNNREQKKLKLDDLVQMFKHKPQENLQHQWLEYLESEAAVDVTQQISSIKIRMNYLRCIQDLQLSVSFKHPYRNVYNLNEIENDQIDYSQSLNEDDNYIIRKKKKHRLDEILTELSTKKRKSKVRI